MTADLKSVISRAKQHGIVAWRSKFPTTTVTHPKMFEYFKTTVDDFLFTSAVETTKLIAFNTKDIHNNVMYPWIKCVLIRSCILPIGEENF